MSNLDLLIPTSPARVPQSALMWATVEAVNPLRIRVDGPDGGTLIPGEPFTLTPVLVGDRVAVGTVGGQLTIIGRTGGPPSGIITNIPQTPAFTAYGTVFARTISIDPPVPLPPGYYFKVWTAETTSYTIVHNVTRSLDANGRILIRIIQVGSSSLTALTEIGWELKRIPGSTPRVSTASFETSEIDTLVETHESTLI